MTTAIENRVENLDPFGLVWKRPDGPTRVWRVVEGRRKTPDGEVPRFSIQEVPEGLESEVVDFMVKNFINEEPTCVDRGIADDPLAVEEFRTMWRQLLQQGISIVALKVDSDQAAKPVIAGVNILIVITAEEEADTEGIPELQSKRANEVIGAIVKLAEEADVLKKYGVDKYLNAIGLSVDPTFRGQGLGEELLRARDDIGLAYQIPVSETVFTATSSQILASRVGFEVLLEKKYSEILNDEGKVAFPGVTVEYMKAMGKRLY